LYYSLDDLLLDFKCTGENEGAIYFHIKKREAEKLLLQRSSSFSESKTESNKMPALFRRCKKPHTFMFSFLQRGVVGHFPIKIDSLGRFSLIIKKENPIAAGNINLIRFGIGEFLSVFLERYGDRFDLITN
jgi:hypothetical protein